MDETARLLGAAADDLAGMRAELGRHELVFDQQGHGAQRLGTALRAAWAGQVELVGRLADELTVLSTSVRQASDNYRASDGEAR